ncbi:glycosyltransferase [Gryllotalpicola protaetiae]|uniref:Glycosyltransferase n=1 Tax=Gryllotalpicola protaetiae TaxID=2419771 RepID=A0A387BP75_9MICO|nr:glycosyltransferase [Gryllotalpicola protaetiae]AYG04282.1 glycosyltransferase [Gryllotalpicola protaetiae]
MTATASLGTVSVVLVNFRGVDDTLHAVSRLRELGWPGLEIVVVENASGDGSLERLKAEAGDIVLVESKTNLGFAGGCNLGVRSATGQYLAFLNNDARPDENWIAAAVDRFAADTRVGAVASRVLDWEGKNVDFVEAGLTWYGMGYKPLTGEAVPKCEPGTHDVLFGTGSAMFVRRDVFDRLGGFDERYFMFFEDVDLGWRLNLLGYRFVYEPASLAFHKHHASMESYGRFKEQFLLERNALYTLYKNLDDESLARTLAPAMALAIRRSTVRAGADSAELELVRGGSDDRVAPVSRDLLAGAYAIDQFVENLDSLRQSRESIQRDRVVTDARMRHLFGEQDVPAASEDSYLEGYSALTEAFPVFEQPQATRVLIITGDPIGTKMAGPAIRAWAMAEALSRDNVVTLVSLARVEERDAPFALEHVRPGDERAMRRLEADSDVIVFQGLAMALFDVLRKSSKIIVADIYDPMHLEQLEQSRELGEAEWTRHVSDATDVLNEQLERGDFFLCASERQRHFYLGQLAALGRLNPKVYENDPDLTQLIDVVPFGLSSTPPVHERAVLKGVVPGIGEDDKVLLWGGGLYNWFDPKTLIRAVAALAETRPQVRLLFQGTKHPHPGVPEMQIVAESRALAAELGALGKNVFFNDSWVDYADRQNYLTEADAGVSTHFAHVETTFSFRTRILDYLWGGLPMVVTAGDHFAELVEREKLGIVVGAEDLEGLTAALDKVLFDERFAATAKRNVARVRQRFYWEAVLEPLTAFVAAGRHAPDLVASGRVSAERPNARKPRRRRGLMHDLSLVAFYLRNGGPVTVVRKAVRRLTR